MKIEGPGPSHLADRNRRRKVDAKGGGFAETLGSLADDGDHTAPVAGVGATAGVEALLAVQTATDDTPQGRRRHAYGRASLQLDTLSHLQRRLAADDLSIDELERLAGIAAAPRPAVEDPGLTQVLDEIDLRVQVELAKRGR